MDSKTQSLRNIRNIIIIGNGNVAIDIARICLKDIEELRQTDITPEAADFIQKIQNTLEAVYIVGRRGHIQSSFTIKELRELSRLTNNQQPIPTFFQPDELKEGMTLSSGKEIENNRPKKRIIDLMETINKQNPYTGSTRSPRIEMRFLLSPTELKSSDGNAKDSHISSVVFNRNRLVGDPFHQRAVAMENETIELPCDLLIKSIGYKSVAVDSLIPFNPKTNTVENKNGKVLMPVSTQKFAHQLFVTGWLKRGPSGIIGTNISDAKETMSQVIETIQSNNLPSYPLEYDPIHTLKTESNSNQKILDGVISWSEVQRINQVELERGEKCTPNKIRWKITNAQEMVKIAKSTSE